MKKFLIASCVASTIAFGSVPGFAADLTPDQQTELRQRAEALQAERQRNPGWDGGRTQLNRTRGDVQLDRNRGEVKNPRRGDVRTPPRSGVKAKAKGTARKGEPVRNKVKRAAKQLPGALVRKDNR